MRSETSFSSSSVTLILAKLSGDLSLVCVKIALFFCLEGPLSRRRESLRLRFPFLSLLLFLFFIVEYLTIELRAKKFELLERMLLNPSSLHLEDEVRPPKRIVVLIKMSCSQFSMGLRIELAHGFSQARIVLSVSHSKSKSLKTNMKM